MQNTPRPLVRSTVPRLRRHVPSYPVLISAIGLALAALLPTGAQAQSNTYTSSNNAMGNPSGSDYVGINAGSSDLNRPISGFGVFGGNNQSSAYSLYFGHYFPGQNYGYEVGYIDFGSHDRDGGNTKVDGINLSFVGRLPLNSSFNLLGKIGTTYGRTTVSTAPSSNASSGSERGFDWAYGVGAELLFSPEWSGVLQYSEHYVKYPPDSHERASATMLGLRYRY